MNVKKIRLAVLVSGRGSNLQAMIDSIERGELSAEIAVVISNLPGVEALKRAKIHGARAVCVDSKKYKNREAHEKAVIEEIKKNKAELVCLAGYMRLLSPRFVKTFKGRMMNIHPALLPAFPGLDVQEKALEYGVKYTGCTVHFVDEGCDTGPIIVQIPVPVLDHDTDEDLSRRILEQEHKAYPLAIQLFAEGKLHIKGRRVFIKEGRID